MLKDVQTQKSKMSQEEEGGGNEVHLGLPCGRQKNSGEFQAQIFSSTTMRQKMAALELLSCHGLQ